MTAAAAAPAPPRETPREPLYERKRWTAAEVEALTELGAFGDHRYELIEGDLISKMGQKPPHIMTVNRLTAFAFSVFGDARVSIQAPIGIGRVDPDNDPEPDIAVLREDIRGYTTPPTPATDILLVAEASDSTLAGDLNVKAAIYARAGIPEYWVVDINRRRLIVHRDPRPDGYASVTRHEENEAVFPLSAPDRSVAVADLLP